MKVILALTLLLFGAAVSDDESCYKEVLEACNTMSKESLESLGDCGASYSGIKQIAPHLQAYVNTHITRSFEYLLTATHYGSYQKSRKGFEGLFRKLSDSKWEEAINLIKYIAKRGEKMNFSENKPNVSRTNSTYELYELESIAKAIDVEKDLAVEAHKIHEIATRRHHTHYDPEVSSYLETEFLHKQALGIRKLAGYATDLARMIKSPDSSLALYLFDEYLQKNAM